MKSVSTDMSICTVTAVTTIMMSMNTAAATVIIMTTKTDMSTSAATVTIMMMKMNMSTNAATVTIMTMKTDMSINAATDITTMSSRAVKKGITAHAEYKMSCW